MIESILVATNDIDRDDIERLRGDCIDVVKRTNGNIDFKKIADWQNGKEVHF